MILTKGSSPSQPNLPHLYHLDRQTQIKNLVLLKTTRTVMYISSFDPTTAVEATSTIKGKPPVQIAASRT